MNTIMRGRQSIWLALPLLLSLLFSCKKDKEEAKPTASSPTITALNPTTGTVGTSVTITGANFSTSPASNTVKFNGTAATVTTATATQLTTSVPQGATSGAVTVTVNNQTATGSSFTVTAPTATAPTITSISPTSGPAGTSVTITGTNFSTTAANNTVTINDLAASVSSASATSLVVTVPQGATTGTVKVSVAGQTVTGPTFTVTAPLPPTITSINPTSGVAGTTVTITGTNFSTTAASNTVKFNGTIATVTAVTSTQLTVKVPAKAGDGALTVTVGSNTATGPNFDYLESVTVSTLAGSTKGFSNNPGNAQFNYPYDVAVDAAGNLYVADQDNYSIRKITSTGQVSTLASTTSTNTRPAGVTADKDGNVYVADYKNHRILKITSTGTVTTLAGSGVAGGANGTGTAAQFNKPSGIAVDKDGNVYVADYDNHRIRKITPAGVVSTLAGSSYGFADGTGNTARFYAPAGITVDASGNLYVADQYNHRIRKIVVE